MKQLGLLTACMWIAALGMCGRPASAAEKNPAEHLKPAIELGAPFADNAILQRQMKVPVWGWSKPGENVTVEFAGQKKAATAGKDGKWIVELDELKANAVPQEMVITERSGKRVALKNILVGEVWMASGQSNMQWLAGKCDVAMIIADLSAKGEHPPIREYGVSSVAASLHPVEKAIGEWKDGDYADYSAIAFAFAHKLYEELQVPIGILNCSFSQTSIEAWTPRCGFADGKDEYTKSVYQRILETDPTTPEHKAAWDKYYQDLENTLKENAEFVKNGQPAKPITQATPGNLRDNRDASWMFNGRLNPVIPYAIRGCIWNQGYANIGGGITYYDNLHSLIRGWRKCWNRPDLPVYFHQFYCPNGVSDQLSIADISEMRLGALLARDIPHTGMASQIDVSGAIHYRNKAVPGQRLALHALKNQYGKNVVADGPIFKSYEVKGDKVVVEFDFAQGGLVVAETGTNALGKKEQNATGFSDPKIIDHGEDKVTLFYLADENRVWHRANMRIDGDKVVVTSPKVASPRGVAYATGGVGFMPNLYNRALLPMAPFIYYDNKPVTSKTWPDTPIKIEGVVADSATMGKKYEYRKMPLLSTQFRDNAVIQAGEPVVFWGSAVHDWGYEAKGAAVIKFSFAGIEKTIPVAPGMREWQVTVPPMPASADPKTLKVVFEIDGEVAHERVCKNIVVGDVWYVSAPNRPKGAASKEDASKDGGMVRVMTRRAGRATAPNPSRYSVSVSTLPDNRFASQWSDADGGFAGALGRRIHAKTGKPVGIIYMDGKDLELKHWMSRDRLNQVPALMEDYKQLASVTPGNLYYDANVRRYIADWKKYWGESVPQLMATKRAMNNAAWGSYPSLSGSVATEASQAYNVMVDSFGPGSFKGGVFMCGESMCGKDQGANYGAELSVLANCWKEHFGCPDPHFVYAIPSKALAPKITAPQQIKGKSTACEIGQWSDDKQMQSLIDTVMKACYE